MNKNQNAGPEKKQPQIPKLLFIVVICANLALCVFHVAYSPFDYDELEHTHIVWNAVNGKIIYRDFFDNHGPVFPMINTMIFRLFELKPAFDTIFKLRYVSLITALAILAVTYKIGKDVIGNDAGGLLSTAFLSSLVFFQDKACEIRPDGIQTVFWLLGTYQILCSFGRENRQRMFLAGLAYGMAISTNAKAAVGPAIVLALFGTGYLLKKTKHAFTLSSILSIASGMALVFTTFLVYFLAKNAAGNYIFYNFTFNLMALNAYQTWLFPVYLRFFLRGQAIFTAFSVLGGYFLVKSQKPAFKGLFFTATAFSMAATAVIGFYSQYFLLFLPLLSVTAAYGLLRGMDYLCRTQMKKILLITLVFSTLTYIAAQNTPFEATSKLLEQENTTDYILANTARNEPVAMVLWNDCGGYMFNEDLQYFWHDTEDLSRIFRKIEGHEVFGENYIKALETQRIRFLVVRSLDEYGGLNGYITRNYRLTQVPCVWARIDSNQTVH